MRFKLWGLALLAALQTNFASAAGDVSERIKFDVPGIHPSVRVYSYVPGIGNEHWVLFKYADLIGRAIDYQKRNPDETVEIKLCIYDLQPNLHVSLRPERKLGGIIRGSAFDAGHSESILDLLLRATKVGVQVQVLYHNQEGDAGVDQKLGVKVPHRRIQWGKSSDQQMHNKFLLIKASKDGQVKSSRIYTTTANIDQIANGKPVFNVAQSGLLVYNHPALLAAYNRYFEIIWKNFENQGRFRSAVLQSHSRGQLNYHDAHFAAYFFPVLETTNDRDDIAKAGWSDQFNPVTRMMNLANASSSDQNELLLSAYMIKADDDFSEKLADQIARLYQSGAHVTSVIRNRSEGQNLKVPLAACDRQATHLWAPTHEKNLLLGLYQARKFYSSVGSANFKSNEFVSKANNLLMISESGTNPIYQHLKSKHIQLLQRLPQVSPTAN